MSLRPKTKRRLLILIAGVTLIVGGGTALVNVRLRQLETQMQEFRARAMTEYEHQDYQNALSDFKKYFLDSSTASAASTDADAIYAYADSLLNIPRTDYRHLSEAKASFSRYLELRPGDSNAQHQLLGIYRQPGYETEAITLADALLSKNPNDLPALSTKTQALISEAKYQNALELSEKVNDLSPLDLQQQLTTLALMAQLKQPPETVVARSQALLKAHPGDPRFELLRAAAAADFSHDIEGAKKWLLKAADRTPPDPEFTRILSGAFDRLGMYDQALSLLEKAEKDHKNDAELTAALVKREWGAGQFDAALSHLTELNPTDPAADSRLLGFKALTLFSRDELSKPTTRPVATAIVDALSKRTDDRIAQSWAKMLRARFANPPSDAKDAVKAYQAFEPTDPDNAIARYFLGNAYQNLGETELALSAWRQAGLLFPSWPAPHIQMAWALLNHGRLDEAAIQAAWLQQAPQSLATLGEKLQTAKILAATGEYQQAVDVLKATMQMASSDSSDVQLALASAWYYIGIHMGDNASVLKARDILVALCNRTDASASMWAMLGSTQIALNSIPDAETSFRKSLQLDSHQLTVWNDLAYSILLSNGDLNEARKLAHAAVAAVPSNSSYHDTLARIYAKEGNQDAAMQSFQTAVNLDANNVDALVGLADVQLREGQPEKAATTLNQIDRLLHTTPPLSEPIRVELQNVRAAIKNSTPTTKPTGL